MTETSDGMGTPERVNVDLASGQQARDGLNRTVYKRRQRVKCVTPERVLTAAPCAASNLSAPPPLVPPNVNVGTYPWAPVRMEFFAAHALGHHQSGEPFRALVLLVAHAWREQPAMSLPNDDGRLASMAGFGRDVEAWAAVRNDVLRDWVLCTDERWHHPEFAVWALQAWASKMKGEAFSQLQRQRALKGSAQGGEAAPKASDVADRNACSPDVSRGNAVATPKKERKRKNEIEINTKIYEKNKEEKECSLVPPPVAAFNSADVQDAVELKEGNQGSDGVDPIEAVFKYWQQKTMRPRERLTDSRRRVIAARLGEGLTVETLCAAIDGASVDDFYQGRTLKSSMRCDTLDVICKDSDRVLRLASLTDSARPPATDGLSPAAQATARSFRDLMASMSGLQENQVCLLSDHEQGNT